MKKTLVVVILILSAIAGHATNQKIHVWIGGKSPYHSKCTEWQRVTFEHACSFFRNVLLGVQRECEGMF